MPEVSFTVTEKDARLIKRVLRRAKKYEVLDKDLALELQMDITACHCNGTPLDIQKLLGFDDFNFKHDVYGINRHLDRTTGKLMNCFLPRCST